MERSKLVCQGTVSPPYTVILYPVNSDLRYLVITTLDSIYGKKIQRYGICVCLQHTAVSPPHSAATKTIVFFFFPAARHCKQSCLMYRLCVNDFRQNINLLCVNYIRQNILYFWWVNENYKKFMYQG